MPRPKRPPQPSFGAVRIPPRLILISEALTPFCEAVYASGHEPHETYRACDMAQAARMQRDWHMRGIESRIKTVEGTEHAMADEAPTDLVPH